MSEELKPCPACGAAVTLEGGDQWYNRRKFFIRCLECHVCDVGDTERSKCIRRWNALPRRLRWTHEPPTVPGWYWHKNCLGITQMEIRAGETILKIEGWLWAGPIPMPEDTQ